MPSRRSLGCSPGSHSRLQHPDRVDDVPDEHAQHVLRLRGSALARPRACRVGVSETILGLPFEREPPAYAPIDEEHPARPESSYALSKLLAEELGRQLYRSTGTPYVALRFSNIMEPQDYERFPSFWGDSRLRRWNLWGYIDARDVAQSCRL